MQSRFDNAIEELLQEPELRAAYDRQAAIILVAKMIRGWRERAGLTQTELARRLKTQQAVISRMESSDNDSMPNVDTLAAIAHACNGQLLIGMSNTHAQQEKMLAL